MYNFDPYNVLLSIATNIPVLLMTAFVLQGHTHIIYIYIYFKKNIIFLPFLYFSNFFFAFFFFASFFFFFAFFVYFDKNQSESKRSHP